MDRQSSIGLSLLLLFGVCGCWVAICSVDRSLAPALQQALAFRFNLLMVQNDDNFESVLDERLLHIEQKLRDDYLIEIEQLEIRVQLLEDLLHYYEMEEFGGEATEEESGDDNASEILDEEYNEYDDLNDDADRETFEDEVVTPLHSARRLRATTDRSLKKKGGPKKGGRKKGKKGKKANPHQLDNQAVAFSATSNPTSGITDSTYPTTQTYVPYSDFQNLQNQFTKLSKAMACLNTRESNKTDLVFEGCNVYIRNGNVQGQTLLSNGLGNLILGYNENFSCQDGYCSRTGSHNLVVGQNNDWIGSGGIVAGEANRISGSMATITGGYMNSATGLTSSVSGGRQNLASGEDSVMVGGEQNVVSGIRAVVVGGVFNEASGRSAAVLSGLSNIASGYDASVTGGAMNNAFGMYATVGAGRSNVAGGLGSFVGGGQSNQANGTQSFIAGGTGNIITGYNEVNTQGG